MIGAVPWKAHENRTVHDANGVPLMRFYADREEEVNAARVVASVNALADIPVEAIDGGVVRQMIDALHTIRDGNVRPGHVAYLSRESMAAIADMTLARVGVGK